MLAFILEVIQSVVLIIYYCVEYLVLWVFPQRKSIKDEVVLITGGGSGIGRLMALKMADLGAVLVLWDVNEKALQGVTEEIKTKGGRAVYYRVDVTDAEAVNEAAKKVVETVGPVTILVNNAGIVSGKRLLDITNEQMRRTLNVNCISHFWTVRAFLPSMIAANHGHVVTVASAAGLIGTPGLVDYCASKFGAVGFTESLRNELMRLDKPGVKTLLVCPFFISTGLFEGAKTKFPYLLPILEPEYAADK
eukprot:Ihof_evm4s391 gene=Ihof_evmTU4s391